VVDVIGRGFTPSLLAIATKKYIIWTDHSSLISSSSSFKGVIHSGVGLDANKKARVADIEMEDSQWSSQFDKNVINSDKEFNMVVYT